ncbi:MAG TPA: hypothetical protein VFL57_20335 [Bryobacteraceae bacterium]|nr:hypothetical protein [Bryobacteraceae bacterium]
MKTLRTILLSAAVAGLSSTAAHAARITDGNREPVRLRIACNWSQEAETARCETWDVPEGKRLIVEAMTVHAFLTPSAELFATFGGSEDPRASDRVRLHQQPGRHVLKGRRIVAEGGTKLNVIYRPRNELAQYPWSRTAIIQVSGYLEPAL